MITRQYREIDDKAARMERLRPCFEAHNLTCDAVDSVRHLIDQFADYGGTA